MRNYSILYNKTVSSLMNKANALVYNDYILFKNGTYYNFYLLDTTFTPASFGLLNFTKV